MWEDREVWVFLFRIQPLWPSPGQSFSFVKKRSRWWQAIETSLKHNYTYIYGLSHLSTLKLSFSLFVLCTKLCREPVFHSQKDYFSCQLAPHIWNLQVYIHNCTPIWPFQITVTDLWSYKVRFPLPLALCTVQVNISSGGGVCVFLLLTDQSSSVLHKHNRYRAPTPLSGNIRH